MQLYNRMIALSHIFCSPLTLNEGHGHLTWHQTLKSTHVHHQTKFERNQFIGIQMPTILKYILSTTNPPQNEFSPLNIKPMNKFYFQHEFKTDQQVVAACQISSQLNKSLAGKSTPNLKKWSQQAFIALTLWPPAKAKVAKNGVKKVEINGA